jgi:hypothetical protein
MLLEGLERVNFTVVVRGVVVPGVVVLDLLLLLSEIVTHYGNVGHGVYAFVILVLNLVVCVGLLRKRSSARLVVVSATTGLVDIAFGVFEIVGQSQLRYPNAAELAFWVAFSFVNAAVCLLGVFLFSRIPSGGSA